MTFLLNGWQRLGVVASIAWALGGGYWGNDMGIHGGDYVVSAYSTCLETSGGNDVPCTRAFNRDFPEAVKYHWAEAAVTGLVPIPFGWLLAYGSIGLWRWIARGFGTGEKDATAPQKTGAKRSDAE